MAVNGSQSLVKDGWSGCGGQSLDVLEQWFSTFLMLQAFNTVPHCGDPPAIKEFLLLLYNCDSAAVMSNNANT